VSESKILLIIPTKNESKSISTLLNEILSMQVVNGLYTDILIVDDSDDDLTKTEIEKVATNAIQKIHVLSRTINSGVATAYVDGYRWALQNRYEYFVQLDADGQHRIADVFQILEMLLKTTHDFVFGSRYVIGGATEGWSFFRKLVSKLANFYFRLFHGRRIMDATSGIRGGSVESINEVFSSYPLSRKFTFHAEFTAKILKSNFSFCEVPIIFLPRSYGISKMTYSSAIESIKLIPFLG